MPSLSWRSVCRNTGSSARFEGLPSNKSLLYQKPQLLTTFGLDNNGVYTATTEPKILFPLLPDDLPLNLHQGFLLLSESSPIVESSFHKPKVVDSAENLDNLLLALSDLSNRLDQQGLKLAFPQLVTWRGIMTKLLTAAITKETFILKILYFKDCMYIMEHKEAIRRCTLQEETQRNFYLGHKFESLCTISQETWLQYQAERDNEEKSRSSVIEALKEAQVCEAEQFDVVIKSKLGRFRIFLGAEIDCKSRPTTIEPLKELDDFVEIKTHFLRNVDDIETFEPHNLHQKGLRIWAQSFLVGIPKIYMGFRLANGDLVDCRMIPLSSFMPKKDSKSTFFWSPSSCLSNCTEILNFLERSVLSREPNSTWLAAFDRNGITMTCRPDIPSFLPPWWLDRFK